MKVQPIPSYFQEIEVGATIWQIFKAFAIWLLPGALACLIVFNIENIYLMVFVIVVAAWFGGHGLQCVALLGHEGTHFTLHRDRGTSAFLGVILSSFAPFHMDVGFAVSHAEHHAFTNTARDPDFIFFGGFKNFFSRLFLARSAASRRYLATTLRLAFARWPSNHPIRIGLTMPEMIRLARINLASSFGILLVYMALTILFPLTMAVLLWIPFTIAMLISGLRPFVEHLETKTQRGQDSRSWISPYFDFLYGSINYHQAHHLWPRVPAYNLKALHNWLRENNAGIDAQSIQISSIGEFIRTTACGGGRKN